MTDASMSAPRRRPFLDTLIARLIALLIFLACVATFLYFNRDLLFGIGERSATEQALARCIAERSAAVDRMVEEGAMGQEQAETARARAGEICRAELQTGGAGQP